MLQSKNVNNEGPIVLMQRTKYNAMAMLKYLYSWSHFYVVCFEEHDNTPNPHVVVSHAHVNP